MTFPSIFFFLSRPLLQGIVYDNACDEKITELHILFHNLTVSDIPDILALFSVIPDSI